MVVAVAVSDGTHANTTDTDVTISTRSTAHRGHIGLVQQGVLKCSTEVRAQRANTHVEGVLLDEVHATVPQVILVVGDRGLDRLARRVDLEPFSDVRHAALDQALQPVLDCRGQHVHDLPGTEFSPVDGGVDVNIESVESDLFVADHHKRGFQGRFNGGWDGVDGCATAARASEL